MGYRLSKIYTRTGDDGTTNLGTNLRLPKDDPRVELLGTLDELNSAIGMIIVHEPFPASLLAVLIKIQNTLFDLGGQLCPPYHEVITNEHVLYLEKMIDEWNATLPPLKEFVLPGGNIQSATCHLARTICRRTERCAVTAYDQEKFSDEILKYLNRLSDLLFVAARILSRATNTDEILWDHERK